MLGGGFRPGIKYDKEGREAKIVRSVNVAELQLELSRVLFHLLSLHPQTSDLSQELQEVRQTSRIMQPKMFSISGNVLYLVGAVRVFLSSFDRIGVFESDGLQTFMAVSGVLEQWHHYGRLLLFDQNDCQSYCLIKIILKVIV